MKSLDDLVKTAPLNFGTTGAGTGSQLAQALLFASAKAKATDVPFDGGAELITALLGKQVDVGANQIAEAASQIKAGKLRPIAVFADQRIESLPDVKTAKEQGFDIVVDQRRWIAAPKDVPEDVLASLRKSVATAAQDPGVQAVPEGQLHLGVGRRARPGQDRRSRPPARNTPTSPSSSASSSPPLT